MIKKQARDIPPGLLRILREKKPSKAFFLLLGLSAFLVLSGFGVLFLYKTHYPSSIESSSKINNIVTQSPSQLIIEKQENNPDNTEKGKVISSVSMKDEEKSRKIFQQQMKEDSSEQKIVQKKEKKSELKELPISHVNILHGSDYLYRAQDFEKRGMLLDAINEYKEYINYTNRSDEKILNKIAVLYLNIGNLKDANHYIELAMKNNVNNKEILINYGVIKAKMGEFDKAEESFLRVLSLEPENKNALFNLSLLKEKRGQYKEALHLYERLYQLGDLSALQSIERLKNYR